jgi:acetoin utilization deacetylase AcuC-like enzyme
MVIYHTDQFEIPLPEGHRFPINKYKLLRERLERDEQFASENFKIPEAASDDQISLVHAPEYLDRVVNGALSAREILKIGFPWSPQLVERTRRSVGGTISACREALTNGGISTSLAGGTHHAFREHGEGYCIFNDAAIAARVMQNEGLAQRVIILDCDVHQGNGTAAIFQHDPTVYTFSIHAEKNFPFHKERSDLDIALPDGTIDRTYLEALERGLQQSLPEAEAELAIYLAGADPFAGDRLGRIALSKSGLAARDKIVLDYCYSFALPLGIVLSGGYAPDIEDTVDIHFRTIDLSREYAQRYNPIG